MKIAIIADTYEMGEYLYKVTEYESPEKLRVDLENLPEILEYRKFDERLKTPYIEEFKFLLKKRDDIYYDTKHIFRDKNITEVLEMLSCRFEPLEEFLETIKW